MQRIGEKSTKIPAIIISLFCMLHSDGRFTKDRRCRDTILLESAEGACHMHRDAYGHLKTTHQPDQLISLDGCVCALYLPGQALQLHLADGNTHQLFLEFLLFMLGPSGSFFRSGPTLQLYYSLKNTGKTTVG